MLEIRNVKVYDLEESIIACRNAMKLEIPDYNSDEFQLAYNRACKLVKANNNKQGVHCHANFRTGIRVSFDLKYSQYITKQLQRYHWFDYVSSSSMMHRVTKMDLKKCCNKYVDPRIIEIVTEKIDDYNNTSGGPEAKYAQFMGIISNMPMGAELFTRVSTNYEQLATIYRQRKHHKLKEDWGAFCKFVESLPYAKDLIIGDYGDETD